MRRTWPTLKPPMPAASTVLKAIFGNGGKASPAGPKLSLADKFRAAMSKRGTQKVMVKP